MRSNDKNIRKTFIVKRWTIIILYKLGGGIEYGVFSAQRGDPLM
jgi:hypothetical protein